MTPSPEAPVDLHLHSTASDGAYPPAQVVRMAREKGLAALALTDHDTVDGIPEALAAGAELGIEVIPGVELGCDTPFGELHLLGYWIDPHHPRLLATLKGLREGRLHRGRAIVRRLNELGVPLAWDRVQALAEDGPVGRPHIAQALVEGGFVADLQEAFDRYLADDAPAYVPRPRLEPTAAVELIREAGGVPVLAHPSYLGERPEPDRWEETLAALLELLPALLAAGLEGIEAYYGTHTPEQIARFEAIAAEHGLVPTGGTDFHGWPTREEPPLGSAPVTYRTVQALRARREKLQRAGG